MSGLTLLVDASSLIYRAYYSSPDSIKTRDGATINAAYGFLHMLARLVTDREPGFIVCATDEDWRPQWRVDLIETYKSHRTEQTRSEVAAQTEDELEHQMPIIREILSLMNIAVAGVEGYEAEDVIGALVPRCIGKVEIVSGDRDLFQLVRDPDVKVLYPKRGVSELLEVDEKYIEDKYGIPGTSYGDFAILRGDPSDGLPGVVGIGEKTAKLLIAKHLSLGAVIEAAMTGPGTGPLGKVKTSLDYLDRAAQVVLISPDIPLGDVDMTRPTSGFDKALVEVAGKYGLKTPVLRLMSALEKGSK